MKLLINYANNVFRKSQKLNSKTGLKVGLFDEVISYFPKDIEPDFFERNKKILRQKRGNGYWLWKPYFIKKALDILNFGDFLFYCDSGSYFVRPITPLIDICSENGQDLIVFNLDKHIERVWTKRDAFILMDCESPKYSETEQRYASFSLWKKSKFTMDFINEFLHFAQDERIITDLDNQCGYPNYPGFKENRHDQSIFSLLTKKYDIDVHRDPSQWGNGLEQYYPNSKYEQIIEHTRRRAPSFRKAMAKIHSQKIIPADGRDFAELSR
ncbi:hypothetical protein ACFL2O_01965 [Thermodesulfobacteriota bacterium]